MIKNFFLTLGMISAIVPAAAQNSPCRDSASTIDTLNKAGYYRVVLGINSDEKTAMTVYENPDTDRWVLFVITPIQMCEVASGYYLLNENPGRRT
jgi:hypothetical protein